jgi:glutathione S-transferase
MQLIYHPASPFVRKVRVVAQELGLGDAIELVHVGLTIGKYNSVVGVHNPLGKVPALITDDGAVLYDSYVICDYLESLNAGPHLIPATGEARWGVLRLHALADGIIEAGQLLRHETIMRAPDATNAGWMELQASRVGSGLDLANSLIGDFREEPDFGRIALACTIGWLEFRSLVAPLRQDRSALFAWYDRFSARPSMSATIPTD